ncbi:cupin domain-containing protein [soil metagenome]
MKFIGILGLLTALASHATTATAHETGTSSESVAPRLQMPIPNLPGETFTSAIVTFPPGAKAVPHRHGEALVYAYVLSGSVRSQLDDQPAKVYRTGDDWYEAPGAHHKVTENTSKTAPARLLVVFVSPTGTPLKTPD